MWLLLVIDHYDRKESLLGYEVMNGKNNLQNKTKKGKNEHCGSQTFYSRLITLVLHTEFCDEEKKKLCHHALLHPFLYYNVYLIYAYTLYLFHFISG